MGYACLAGGGLGFRSDGQRKEFYGCLEKKIAGCACFLDRPTAPDFTYLFPQSILFVSVFPFPPLSHFAGLETDRSDFSYFDTRGVDSLSFSILDRKKREMQIQ